MPPSPTVAQGFSRAMPALAPLLLPPGPVCGRIREIMPALPPSNTSHRSPSSTGCGWPVVVIHTCLLLWGAPPAVGQPRSVEPLATVPGPVAVVHADGALAVLANGNELTVLDLTDPGAPAKRGTLTLSDQIWDLVVDGERAYVANGFVGFVVADWRNKGNS